MDGVSVVEQIVRVLEVARYPLSAADIHRRLDDSVALQDVSCRMCWLRKRGRVQVVQVDNPAITGRRRINAFVLVR